MRSIRNHHPKSLFKQKTLAFMLTNALIFSAPFAMATDYLVISNTDDGNTATVGSLSWAITQANLSVGNTITIDVGVATIAASGVLPTLTQAVALNSNHNVAITGTINADALITLTGTGVFSFIGANGSAGALNVGGDGGDGGDGGKAISGSGFTLTSNATITGGNGGVGGEGSVGDGGNGGNAGKAISGSGFTLTNNATITGGNGGFGGLGGDGLGGGGGNGGEAISGSGFTLTNNATITGGFGGFGGNGFHSGGNGGNGGDGIHSTGNASIINASTISGGNAGAGGTGTTFNGSTGFAGNAITLSGGGNSISMLSGSVANGHIISTSGSTNGGDSLSVTNATINGNVSGFAQFTAKAGGATTITGNYTQAATDVFRTHVTDDTTFGKLVVGGTVTLASNAKIDVNVSNPNFSFTTALTNGMADIISAGTLISDGTFSVTDNSLLFNFDAVKDGNTVDLILSAATSTTLTSTINSGKTAGIGAARIIDTVIASNPTGPLASHFISLTTEQEVANAVESTLPSVSGGVAELTNISLNVVTDVVAARQDLTRGFSSGDGFMTDRHIWFKPFGNWTEQDDRQGVTGYDIDSYGLALGFDGDVSASWTVGFALAYIDSDVDSKLAAGAHTIDIDSYQAKVYATNRLDDVTALNLQAGVGLSNYDSHRRIFTGDVASADYDSWNIQLSAELERHYSLNDKTVLTPYVHADYGYVDAESYNESGAGALNLNVGDDSSDSLIIGAGVKVNHTVSDSLLLMANAGVGYDVMTDRSNLTSSFAGGGANFTTKGIEQDELVYNAGLGAKYSLENGTELTANYNIDGRQDYTDQSVSVNFRVLF